MSSSQGIYQEKMNMGTKRKSDLIQIPEFVFGMPVSVIIGKLPKEVL